MDRDFLRNLLIAGGVFLVIVAIGPRLLPTPPVSPPSETPTTSPLSANPVAPAGESSVPAGPSSTKAGADKPNENVVGYTAVEDTVESTFVLGDEPGQAEAKDSPFRTRLTVSNVGASIESALLNDHAAKLESPERYSLLSPVEQADGSKLRSLAIEKINIDGQDVALHDKRWHATAATASGAEAHRADFSIEIQKDAAPALRLTRTISLPRQSKKEGRHDLNSSLTVENLSTDPHRIVMTTRGAVGLPQQGTRDDRVIDWGTQAATGHVVGNRTTLAAITQKPAATLWAWSSAEPSKRLAWAASGNMYFTCTIAPVEPDGKPASYVTELAGVDLDANPMTVVDATVKFVSASVEVRAGGQVVYPASVYLGEKDGKAFRQVPEYAARNYYYQIEQGFGICTFTFLVELMIWLLNSLYFIFRDFGVAIVILVLIVRALLHPITKKGQINMVRMQHKMGELGPKIEEIKRKYANDKVRLNQEMMKLDINPAGQIMTCLPMFLQMPIWVALYLSLSNNILMRHESPFYGLTWIPDLTAQDALIQFSSPIHIPLFGWELTSFNVMPLLVGLFMYIQQKTQPKPKPNPNMTEQQRQQQEAMQRMMPMMSAMMVLIFYKMPSGLNLYVMFSSLFGWLEQRVIRKHIREREAAGTLHKPPRWGTQDVVGKPAGRDRKLSWFERLQKAAEAAQKAQRMPKGKKR
jgi:YidC/Oxa1 family membrane protein insertase